PDDAQRLAAVGRVPASIPAVLFPGRVPEHVRVGGVRAELLHDAPQGVKRLLAADLLLAHDSTSIPSDSTSMPSVSHASHRRTSRALGAPPSFPRSQRCVPGVPFVAMYPRPPRNRMRAPNPCGSSGTGRECR